MSFIEVNNISKTYKVAQYKHRGVLNSILNMFNRKFIEVNAVNNISFSIDEQEIVGYIGPNGAGKSTTIKMLSGILTPDKGKCIISGFVPWESRIKYVKNIGVLFGQRSQLLWDLPVIESFKLLCRIYKLDNRDYMESLEYLKHMLDLNELMPVPVRQLSLGQRVRCEFAATFLHKPKLVFLDEPTIGLDIEIKKKIHNFVKAVNKKHKTTIFLTTHDLDDIESLCSRLMIIDKGNIYFDNTLEKLFSEYFIEKRIHIKLMEKQVIQPIEGTSIQYINDMEAVVEIQSKDISPGRIVSTIARNYSVHDISIEKTEIDDVILKIYESMKG